MDDNRQLDKVINIDDTKYDVNAVHSDAAGKVDHKLTIKQDPKLDVAFNGSADEEIEIVPKTGGEFLGSVRINSQNRDLGNTDLLTKAEIENELSNLTGISWYEWDGEKLKPVVDETASTTPYPVKRFNFVVDKSIHNSADDAITAANTFARSNNSESIDNTLPAFIYLSSVNVSDSKKYIKSFFGTADSDSVTEISSNLYYYNKDTLYDNSAETVAGHQQIISENHEDILAIKAKIGDTTEVFNKLTVATIADALDSLIATDIDNKTEIGESLKNISKFLKGKDSIGAGDKAYTEGTSSYTVVEAFNRFKSLYDTVKDNLDTLTKQALRHDITNTMQAGCKIMAGTAEPPPNYLGYTNGTIYIKYEE